MKYQRIIIAVRRAQNIHICLCKSSCVSFSCRWFHDVYFEFHSSVMIKYANKRVCKNKSHTIARKRERQWEKLQAINTDGMIKMWYDLVLIIRFFWPTIAMIAVVSSGDSLLLENTKFTKWFACSYFDGLVREEYFIVIPAFFIIVWLAKVLIYILSTCSFCVTRYTVGMISEPPVF